MTAELWPQNPAYRVLNTRMLSEALPYRGINSELIYSNVGSIGFGLQLNIDQPHALSQITTLLTQCQLHYTLYLYHHHMKYQWVLFVSTKHASSGLLHQTRQHLETNLNQMTMAYQRLCSNHFLTLLRSIISPNLLHNGWPGLIDIQHKSFHTIIPNPGTEYTLTPNHIDIVTPDAYATWRTSRITLLQKKHDGDGLQGFFQSPLCPWKPRVQLQNWVMSFDRVSYRLMLISTPKEAYQHAAYAYKAHIRHLPLEISSTHWISFLENLPFSRRYPQTTQ